MPFPGWTLPGVLTVGAAQILLKSAGPVPDKPVWIAGCGPLPLLYADAVAAARRQDRRLSRHDAAGPPAGRAAASAARRCGRRATC